VSGFYILEKLVSLLPENFSGTLTIVPSANPLGLIHRQRFVPLDEEDLNRGYPPPPKARGVSAAYRNSLIQLGLAHDFIIDLHTFVRPCLDAGLFLPQSSEKNTMLVKRFLQALDPETVFSMDIKREEQREASALGVYMIAQGKPFVAIEYPPVRQMNEEFIVLLAGKLFHALSSLNTNNASPSAPSKEISLFERQQIISQ
jgi:predicted deacylase